MMPHKLSCTDLNKTHPFLFHSRELRKKERKKGRERERERQREREREEGREEKVKDMDQCGNFGGREVGGGGTGCGGINDDGKKKEKRRKKAYGVQVRRIMNLVINLYHK